MKTTVGGELSYGRICSPRKGYKVMHVHKGRRPGTINNYCLTSVPIFLSLLKMLSIRVRYPDHVSSLHCSVFKFVFSRVGIEAGITA
jgi:hypothetical protein